MRTGKKIRIVMIVSLFAGTSVFAQVRNLEGMQSVGCSFGATKLGFYFAPVYERVVLPKFSVKGELLTEFASYKGYAFNTFTIGLGANYVIYNLKEVAFFKLGGGFMGQVGYLHHPEKLNQDLSAAAGNYGFFLEPEVDIFIFRNWILNVDFKQAYFIRDYLGHFVFFTSVGIKYQF